MSYKRNVVLLCLWFAVFAFTGAAAMADEQKPQGGKAASVNGVVITHEEVNRQMFILEQHLLSTQGTAVRPDMVPGVRAQIINDLIDKELLYQEAQKQKIVVDDKEVSEKMDALKNSFPSEKVFQDEMGRMNFTEETLRTQIKKDLAIQQLMKKDILVHVKVSDEDAKSFYDSHPDLFKEPEKVRASHILIKAETFGDASDQGGGGYGSRHQRGKKEKAGGRKEAPRSGRRLRIVGQGIFRVPERGKGGRPGIFRKGQNGQAL